MAAVIDSDAPVTPSSCAFCRAASTARVEIPGVRLSITLCDECAIVAAAMQDAAVTALAKHGVGVEHLEKATRVGAAANMLAGMLSRRMMG